VATYGVGTRRMMLPSASDTNGLVSLAIVLRKAFNLRVSTEPDDV
jgi:hypothetical protein